MKKNAQRAARNCLNTGRCDSKRPRELHASMPFAAVEALEKTTRSYALAGSASLTSEALSARPGCIQVRPLIISFVLKESPLWAEVGIWAAWLSKAFGSPSL